MPVPLPSRILHLALLGVLLAAGPVLAEPVPPCEKCPDEGWPLSLPPGDLRLALPSPDGSLLALLAGTGRSDREHTLLLLERDCEAGLVQQLEVTTAATYTPAPAELPVPYVHLQWSPDGGKLFAGGTVYTVSHDAAGNLRAARVRDVEGPFVDFRFGPSTRAAAIRVKETWKRDLRGDGRELFTAVLEYLFVSLSRPVDTPLTPREERGIYWIVRDWEEPPRMAWEPDGSTLIFYPYNRVTERFKPGKARESLEGVRPDPPAEAGHGPFRIAEPCPTEWELEFGKGSGRVRVGKP